MSEGVEPILALRDRLRRYSKTALRQGAVATSTDLRFASFLAKRLAAILVGESAEIETDQWEANRLRGEALALWHESDGDCLDYWAQIKVAVLAARAKEVRR